MKFISGTAMAAILILLGVAGGCSRTPKPAPVFNKTGDSEEIKKRIVPAVVPERGDGIAAAILIDTSGSMQDPVEGADRQPKSKLKIAQDALVDLVRQFSEFGLKHPETKLVVGIYDFSVRRGQPSCRRIVNLGPPDVEKAQGLIRNLTPSGATPIGDAMIAAKRDLGALGYSHQHILVITDGESNLGYLPGDVAKVISQEPESDRAGIYFIAFDIGAEPFDAVRDAGGLVLSSTSEKQLTDTLDFILTGKILVEQPPVPPPHPPTGVGK
jgi:hypothetical protein